MRLSRKATANGARSTRLVFAWPDGMAKPSGVLAFEGSLNRRRMHMLLSSVCRINLRTAGLSGTSVHLAHIARATDFFEQARADAYPVTYLTLP
jgi:hypothetical protein